MGKVYDAAGADGTRVALKIVKDELARIDVYRHRFQREAMIAQTVRNPHVVPVVATGEHEGRPYMAAHFIEGNSLETLLKAAKRLPVQTTVMICTQVAEGLQALWEAGMVHRDVKPGNILLDRAGTAYITDFGLAKDSEGAPLTLPGQALGSIDYMAPEQIRGQEVTVQTDVYSLGCVVFECLTGSAPFSDRQGMRILWSHLQDDPPYPDGVAPKLGAAVMTALRKESEDRPASAVAYAELLAAAAAQDQPS